MDNASEPLQRCIKAIHDEIVIEDVAVRERQIRYWRRLKLMWEGFQRVWFNEVAHDWRVYDDVQMEDADQEAYDKPINIFRTYLETIIAALSVTVPVIKCFPDDANNPLDLVTARAGDKISELIYRHNRVSLLWLHALFVFCTEGMIACYSYPKKDASYGTYDKKEYKEGEEDQQFSVCPECKNDLTPEDVEAGKAIAAREMDEYQPGDEDAKLDAAIKKKGFVCPQCAAELEPDIQTRKVVVTRLVGITKEPKTRICLEMYGGLYVKVANYAHNQREVTTLQLTNEIDYSLAVEKYQDNLGVGKRGNQELIDNMKARETSGSYNQYAQWGRLNPQYQGEYPINVVSETLEWVRPCKYNCLKSEDDIRMMNEKFPDGYKAAFVNDCFAKAENESLDDCWTILENPLSDYLHFQPLGNLLISIQEITNDLISLVLQTIEHGIGQTIADPAVFDFKAYEQTEVNPGSIYPAKTLGNKRLGDAIFEFKTATLSGEVMPFYQQILSAGQMVSGALPSLFGGNLGQDASHTASQYSMSRAQALQRLQNTWKTFTEWWEQIFGKVIPMFIQEVEDDERDVQRTPDGNFVNVLITKAELEGRIGRVEIEANENLPLTWSQKADLIKNLIMNPNPLIGQILQAPENLGIIHEALGLDEVYVPNEDEVQAEYDEIKLLLNSTPIPNPQQQDPNQPAGQPQQNPNQPSVDIDPIIDNHQLRFEIDKKWLISEDGRMAKESNPDGYQNVLLHAHSHFQAMQQAMQNQQQQQQQQAVTQAVQKEAGKQGIKVAAKQALGPPPARPNPNAINEAPITGEGNVPTVQ